MTFRSHRHQLLWTGVLAASLSACASYDSKSGSQSAPEAADGGGTEEADTGVGDDGADTGAAETEAWWLLGAEILIEEGQPVAADSLLRYASLTESGLERCTAEASLQRLTTLSPPEEEILAWWQLVPDDWEGSCVTQGLAISAGPSVNLGVGQMHPEILAVLETVESADESSEDSLNAAYARLRTGGDVYVFGVAGPVSAFSGEGTPAEEVPLADGLWMIMPAYSFPSDGR